MEQNSREVKDLVTDIDTQEATISTDQDETDTQSDNSSADEKTTDGDNVDTDDSDTEDDQSESEIKVNQQETTDGDGSREPALVEGETPREKALRLEIGRIRKINSDLRNANLLGTNNTQKESKKEGNVLSKYKPEEVTQLKEIFGELADDLGFVKKGEIEQTSYQTTADSVLDDFVGSHPEYKLENDKDNLLWGRFETEFKTFYKMPPNPKDLKLIFEKIHQSVVGSKPTLNTNSVKAQQQKLKVAAHGGTTISKVSEKRESTIDPSIKGGLKGFSDEELEDIFGI